MVAFHVSRLSYTLNQNGILILYIVSIQFIVWSNSQRYIEIIVKKKNFEWFEKLQDIKSEKTQECLESSFLTKKSLKLNSCKYN